jgi:methylenetetrahydrofolate reductase (NADPH)
LFEALEAKQGIATHMVTQMCFDMPVLLKWLGEMRDRGITTPVWIGLPGVMDRMKLFKTSLRIGVGQSAKYARKQKGTGRHVTAQSDLQARFAAQRIEIGDRR